MGSDNGHPFGRVMVTRKLERLVMIFVAVNSIGIYVYLRGREPCEQMIRGLSGSLGRNPPAVRNLRATAPVPDARPCTACPGRPKLPTRQAGAARPWNSSVRCAFITLLQKGHDETRYAAFLESSGRLRLAFALEREYPHVVFHEGNFPEAHKGAIRDGAPWVVFRDVSDVWGNDLDRPPASEWNATDRSEGYKHMCRFYAMQMWDHAHAMGLDMVMRVDDDIFMLRAVDYDPFRMLWEAGADYAWGSSTRESHFQTELTFKPWVRTYCLWLERDASVPDAACADLAHDVIERMYFNNVFATTVGFWRDPYVKRFLHEIDLTHAIYVHRWGDAPIQTAAIRLFAGELRVRQIPKLQYAHVSTDNLVIDGAVSCLSCDGAAAYFSRLASSRRDESETQRRVASMEQILQRAMPAHKDAFIADIESAGIPHDWGRGASLGRLPVFAFLQLVEKIGVWCDNVGHITTHVLLPSHCCCRLDTYRTTPADKHRVIAAVAQHLQGWMKAMADDDGMGSLWSPPEFHEEA